MSLLSTSWSSAAATLSQQQQQAAAAVAVKGTTTCTTTKAATSAYEPSVTDKLIQISEFNFEETLKQLVSTHAALFPHLLYALLRGRPVVCVSRYCNNLAYLNAVVDCLSK